MTREEAIKVLIDELNYEVEYEGDSLKGRALKMAISAIRAQQQPNAPLTLDELRQMDGEPVWWWNKSAKPVCTICVLDRFMDEPMFANYDWQSEYTLQLSKYKWLKKCGYKPYRQKPEEGTV